MPEEQQGDHQEDKRDGQHVDQGADLGDVDVVPTRQVALVKLRLQRLLQLRSLT
jgi:hypothetical protein